MISGYLKSPFFFDDCGGNLTLLNLLKFMRFAPVLDHMDSGRIYEMRCLFVAVGLNAPVIVLPHWDNMS